VVISVDVLARA